MEFVLNKHSSSLLVYHPGFRLICSPPLSSDSEPTQFATTALAQLQQVLLDLPFISPAGKAHSSKLQKRGRFWKDL